MTESVWINNDGGRWNASALRLLLSTLPHGHYLVTVTDQKGKRTNPQNDRIHATCRLYAKELNAMCAGDGRRWTMEDVKELMLPKFAPTVTVVDPNGEIHERRKRSHEMDVAEAGEFMDCVDAWFLQAFDIVLPEPGQVPMNIEP